MKTYVTYGLYLALGGFVLNLVLYFAGFHSNADKFTAAQWIGGIAGLALTVVILVLGTKARRADVPLTEDFGYGRALGAGVMIGLFSCLFGVVTNMVYTRLINPGFREIMIQAQSAKWEAAGMSSDRIEKAEGFMRSPLGTIINVVSIVIFYMIICTIISLITAAFLKRPASTGVSAPPVSV